MSTGTPLVAYGRLLPFVNRTKGKLVFDYLHTKAWIKVSHERVYRKRCVECLEIEVS